MAKFNKNRGGGNRRGGDRDSKGGKGSDTKPQRSGDNRDKHEEKKFQKK